MPTGRFTFEGFLSVNKKSRKEHLESLINEERTMLFYEAPHKLSNTLKDFANYFPNRKLSIVREITKIHEEVIRTTTDKAYEDYGETGLKGEIVLVLSGKPHKEEEETVGLDKLEHGLSSAYADFAFQNIFLIAVYYFAVAFI